jgi:glycosyltransferase involved in cell wall biosynthesis
VLAQSRQPEAIIVVDDGSTDSTRELIEEIGGDRVLVVASRCVADDRITRIAGNFIQGLQEAQAYEVCVLGDHDDVWHVDRVEHQVRRLDERDHVDMVASDGRLVDEQGEPTGGTLRSVFPVASDFNDMSPALRMRAALRRSIATGGASALRTSAFVDVAVPQGWLHDRWWSLVATARESMLVDDRIVIDYRVSASQQVGLDRGEQASSAPRRMVTGIAHSSRTMTRLRDISRTLPAVATDGTRYELSGLRLLRNLG